MHRQQMLLLTPMLAHFFPLFLLPIPSTSDGSEPVSKWLSVFLLLLTGFSIRVRQAKARRWPAAKSANAPLLLVVPCCCSDFSCEVCILRARGQTAIITSGCPAYMHVVVLMKPCGFLASSTKHNSYYGDSSPMALLRSTQF
jgi:hypothetical protein